MPMSEEDLIATVLELLPTHPSVEALMESDALKDTRAVEIHAALRTLELRGLVNRGELFGRDTPSKDGP